MTTQNNLVCDDCKAPLRSQQTISSNGVWTQSETHKNWSYQRWPKFGLLYLKIPRHLTVSDCQVVQLGLHENYKFSNMANPTT